MAEPYADLGAEYVGQPGWHLLQLACIPLFDAFGRPPYLVGSAVLRKGWRDIDVRVILTDDRFGELFPRDIRPRRLDPWWALMCASISQHLIRATGLPIDFQIQSQTEANAYPGPREALGVVPEMRATPTEETEPGDLEAFLDRIAEQADALGLEANIAASLANGTAEILISRKEPTP